MVPIPMIADDSADKQMVLGAHPSHGIFEKLGLMHVLVKALAQLVEQRILHMPGEFLEHR